MNKDAILTRLTEEKESLLLYCSGIEDALFFRQPAEKWSVAQNVRHLIISANATRLAFSLPGFILKLYAGKPNRPSRSYDELVSKYKTKLQQGGKASGAFIPKAPAAGSQKKELINSFSKSMSRLSRSIGNTREEKLDQYIAPHPLLGKITLRELGYFTIYHTRHHLDIIKERMRELEQSRK